eukprot:m.291327 g.291327  ORF g.291327 m.291327 type:complete len:527 (+) comp12457_c0_seq1:807-2387(+)
MATAAGHDSAAASIHTGPPPVRIPNAVASGRIELSPVEQAIFETCRETIASFNLSTTVRVAGGWVRDKLRGSDSDDIDFALDDMMGIDFAQYINRHLESQGQHVNSIGVIHSAPEQSKHLEVATFKLHGQEVDMNNLRTEEYAQDSRIPTVEIGTPWQDAHRRDLTINSLFYNVNDDSIEDFCGTGISDLENGIIRTPCNPKETFRDDPLRILRVARFAGRYNFRVEPALEEAAMDMEVQAHLANKVTRERFGLEIDKMFKTQSTPVGSFAVLLTFGLYPIVFRIPQEELTPQPEAVPLPVLSAPLPEVVLHDELPATSLELLRRAWQAQPGGLSLDERRALAFAAFLAPLWGYETGKDKKWRQRSLPFYVIRHSLKLPNATGEATVALLWGASELIQAVESVQGTADAIHSDTKLRIAYMLREVGPCYPHAVLLARLFLEHSKRDADAAALASLSTWITESSQLVGCWDWKPLLDGRSLVKLFGVRGPQIGELTKAQLDWMLVTCSRDEEALKAHLTEVLAKLSS